MKKWAFAALILALAVSASSAARAGSAAYPSLSGKWELGEFTVDGGFVVTKAAPLPSGGVTFPFLDRPDTIVLVTDSPAYRGRLLGDLTGKTLVARVGVDVTPGTIFAYFGQSGSGGNPANIRLYFETDVSLGPIVCPCQDKGWSSFWYSNPVRIDLASLQSGEATLAAELDPNVWADGQEVPGDSDLEHLGFFEQAVAHVDHVGITFGGGSHFHNGVGVVPGSGGGSFRLFDYEAMAP